jgi:Lrp/AsnC family leucine-responsive transcriptional regulator
MDLKNRKLLTYLDQNSRQSINQLAKKLQLSNASVKNRIQHLLDKGIIKRFATIIDVGKLQFIPIRIFLKLTHASKTDEQELISFLINSQRIGWVVSVQGYWDINTYFTFKSIPEIHSFYNELTQKFGHIIADKQLGIYQSVVNYTRTYLIEKVTKEKRIITSSTKHVNIQDDEYLILQLLAENSRASILEIAQKTKLTSKTVIGKIKKLEKLQIITGYRIQLDLNKIDYEYYKLHVQFATGKRSDEQIKKLQMYISQLTQVIYEDTVTGGYDIELEVEVQSSQHLRNLVKQIRNRFSPLIADIEVLQYYEQHFERYFPKITD